MASVAGGDQPRQDHKAVRFLIFGASSRKDSVNARLARLAAKTIQEHGGVVDLASMKEFDCPSFDEAGHDNSKVPAAADQFRKRLEACDAFVISSPEYNFSIPGFLKNAIDWVSRFQPQPFNEKQALLISASPSMGGGNRGLWALRVPLEHLGARVYPDMFSLAVAHQAFTPEGGIANSKLAERFENTIVAFMDLVEAAKNYPCMKKAWIEFLGEHPDPTTAAGMRIQ